MEIKTCRLCKKQIPINLFITEQHGETTYYRSCRACHVAKEKQRRAKNPEKHREYRRRWRDKNKESIAASHKLYVYNYPEKRGARRAVTQALTAGRLFRTPCEVCMEMDVEAHHDSYDEKDWLNVRWLCRKHHVEHHTKVRNLEKLKEEG